MRNTILFSLLIAALFTASCNKQAEPFTFDPSHKVYISPDKNPFTKGYFDGDTTYLDSLKRIFDPKKRIIFNFYFEEGGRNIFMGIPHIDYNNYKIAWLADNIFRPDPNREGHYSLKDGLASQVSNMVLCELVHFAGGDRYRYDTVAYVPNTATAQARRELQAAIDRGDYAILYDLFESIYKFRPITGAGYRKLVESGQEILTPGTKLPTTFVYDYYKSLRIRPYRSPHTEGVDDATYLDSLKRIFNPKKRLYWRAREYSDLYPYTREAEGIDYSNFTISFTAYKILAEGGRNEAVYSLGTELSAVSNRVLCTEEMYGRYDTVAYIPNKAVIQVRKEMQSLIDQVRYEELYECFLNTYRYIPITGAGYRKLVESGQEILTPGASLP